jgi:hypothetical protein
MKERSPRPGFLWGYLGCALLMVLLVIPSDSMGITRYGPGTYLAPPFPGVYKQGLNATTMLGCGHVVISREPSFWLKTGLFHFAGVASATNCTAATTAEIGELFLISVPLVTNRSTLAIQINLTVNVSGSEFLRVGSCRAANVSYFRLACLEQAVTGMFALVEMEDRTNHTSVNPVSTVAPWPYSWAVQNSSWKEWSCGYGSCSTTGPGGGFGNFSVNRNVQLFFNVSGLNTTHYYRLQLIVQPYSVCEFETQYAREVGGRCVASLNLGRAGFGARLDSISIH